MHRKDRNSDKYNGVCIEFDKNELLKAMEAYASQFDVKLCQEITYGFDNIDPLLEKHMNAYSNKVREMSYEKDQGQNIIPPIQIPLTKKVLEFKKCIVIPTLQLIDKIDTAAPFIKHSFWQEECETRALLSTKKESEFAKTLKKNFDGSTYYDLQIKNSCISKVILGPEFSEEDKQILFSLDAKITFDKLKTVPSNGTGIITNK